jgi:hypothetical protein
MSKRKDDNRAHVYDADGNDVLAMDPAPRRWLWWAGGAVVLAALAALALTHLQSHAVAAAPRTHHVRKPVTLAQQLQHVPNYSAKTTSGASIFTQIAALNQKYIHWADLMIHKQVPQIPATGPSAGTLTPAILNNPQVIAKWGGPAVPLTLAGIHLPAGTPADGSIVGLTPQLVQSIYNNNGGNFVTGLTVSRLQRAFIKAADFIMAANGSNPASMLQYMDPYALNGQLDQSFLANASNPNYPIVKYFTASAANGGWLPLRDTNYISWVTITPGSTTIGLTSPTTHPTGHVLIGNLAINNITFNTVGSGLVNGKLTVGLYEAPVSQIDLALIQQGPQRHWYVTGMQGDGYGNTPSAIYWTAP